MIIVDYLILIPPNVKTNANQLHNGAGPSLFKVPNLRVLGEPISETKSLAPYVFFLCITLVIVSN